MSKRNAGKKQPPNPPRPQPTRPQADPSIISTVRKGDKKPDITRLAQSQIEQK